MMCIYRKRCAPLHRILFAGTNTLTTQIRMKLTSITTNNRQTFYTHLVKMYVAVLLTIQFAALQEVPADHAANDTDCSRGGNARLSRNK